MTGDLNPAQEVSRHIADHLAALDERINTADTPGNLDGLFARHILHHAAETSPILDAGAAAEQQTSEHDDGPVGAPRLAALGYRLDHLGEATAPAIKAELIAGLRQLMRRDPFPLDGVTFLHDPRQLLGITLTVIALSNDVPDAERWLRQTIDDPRFRATAVRHELIRRHVRGLLTREPSVWTDTGLKQPVDLAILHWIVSRQTVRLPDPGNDLKTIQNGILKGLLSFSPSEVSVLDAAFLRASAKQIIDATIDESMLDHRHVGVVLRRFPQAMRRWRWDTDPAMRNQIKWPITMEREVQDILWLLLSAVFVDLVDEETLRKFGHSSYRADFGIPHLGVLIEVKYVQSASKFKDIEKEVMEDHVAYFKDRSTYQKMVVFIYDASASSQMHAITKNALMELERVIDVVIVSRPSHLPAPEPRRRRPAGAPQQGRRTATPSTETPA